MNQKTSSTTEADISTIASTYTLRPEIARLRDSALERHRAGLWYGIPTRRLIDAQAWSTHSDEEDWLIWRGRRTLERLEAIPIDLSLGERVVGRPQFRPATPEEGQRIKSVEAVLESIPKHPGGDAGHFHPDFEKLFRVGIRGIREEIQSRLADSTTAEQRVFYQACDLAIQGMTQYAERVADECERKALEDEAGAAQWGEIARICRRVSTEPPATFHEAIELMFLADVCLWFGEDHGLTSPGRMDQTLYPFYEADLAAGRITQEDAFELICCLFIQLNMIVVAGLAVAAIVGGRDRNGNDVTNDLTYLCLAARLASKLVYPTVGVAWHEGTPRELMDFSCRMISTGIGDPAFFNDETISQGLREHGVSEPDSYNYMNSTCVEIKVVGASNIWVTAPYFNCPKALLQVMDTVANGSVPAPATFDELNALVRDRMAANVKEAAQGLDNIWRLRTEIGGFPLASCFTSDCLERGLDFDRGGARYNWVENSFVGLANLVDGLPAIKELVYESKELSLPEFWEIIQKNYDGHEDLRWRILNRIPKYGNDNDYVDAFAVEWAEFLEDTTESNIVGLHPYVPGFFCWVVHERFGSDTGATPDGRKAGLPLADGAGAAQGREKCGPTASVLSTTKWNHRKVLGGLVHNVKFSKNALKKDEDLAALRSLIETYLKRGGFEIQINVVSADELRDAQEHPEKYADLLVRVAGYSDYFVHLNPKMQAEVIARTEHTSV